MKVFILGTGKSGTTAMVYKVAGGLPNCQAFSGGKPGKYAGDYQNAVYKHTYEERKGKSFSHAIQGMLPSAACSIAGTKAILGARNNIKRISAWFFRKKRILSLSPFMKFAAILSTVIGPFQRRRSWSRSAFAMKTCKIS